MAYRAYDDETLQRLQRLELMIYEDLIFYAGKIRSAILAAAGRLSARCGMADSSPGTTISTWGCSAGITTVS